MGARRGFGARAFAGVRGVVSADATMLAIPGFLATMGLEYLALRKRRDDIVGLDDPTEASNVAAPVGYETKDTLASLAMGSGMLVIGTAAMKVLAPLDSAIYRRRVGSLGARRGGFAAAVLAWDFLYYWDHRWGHEHRLFWAAHVNHHSSQRYNLSTALRQSWSGTIMHWVFLPMFAAGFTPTQVARAGEVNLLYQYWVHTETVDKLPAAAEAVLNTASHHRVHHGTNPQYLDRNYAGILIIWDRLFGTFEPEGERVHYGLTKNIGTHNPLRIAGHEWSSLVRDLRGATSWSERRNFLFQRPGWEPAVLA